VRTDHFLAQLSAETRAAFDASRIAIVVAHPDDETIGCGATLARMRGVRIIVLTDGAPRDLKDARRCGFSTAADYANARLDELNAALRVAGIPHECVTRFGIPDQEAALHVVDLTSELATLYSAWGIDLVLTHSFEGGHPDHDAAAAAVQAARRLAAQRRPAVAVVEMPYYHVSKLGEVKQVFADPAGELPVWLTPAEISRKREMLACYASQQETLAGFSAEVERFRPAPDYDFSELPNGGRLLYEAHDWNMSAARWRELISSAQLRINEDGSSWSYRS